MPGLRIEVLGNYLASLGLLRLLARKWPSVRTAWHDGVLQVVGGPKDINELLKALVCIARNRAWTPYNRGWSSEQKKSTQQKTGRPLALWQANADETELELFCAHAVPRERVAFNPLLGSGGNAGQREFAKGWAEVVKNLHKPPANVNCRHEPRAWLLGEPVTWMLSGIAAASWFSSANKLYNSGQSPYREEPLSPWAMALACEGVSFFAGTASRRLGARARAQGAFPFVCQAAAPTTAGEAGRDRGEVWAPIWQRPMTLPEVRALFQRGRAEVRGRGANTPGAFAAAIVQRGVDAGVAGFARFALGKTTSANTFEPRYEGMILVHPSASDRAAQRARSDTVEHILALLERLPADRKVRNRWRFAGLRGPIESAMVRLARDPHNPVAFCALLDAVVAALDRVDRNVSHRKRKPPIAWEPLPLDDLAALFANEVPSLEARLGIALVSAFPVSRPFTLYRFGVKQRYRHFEHPESPPARWVFRAGPLARILSDVVMRFTLDWESERKRGSAVGQGEMPIATSAADVQDWLEGQVDEGLLAQWLGRLALFDWRTMPETLRRHLPSGNSLLAADGPLLLAGLFQPLFDMRPLRLPIVSQRRDVFSEESGARTPGAARTMAALIRTGQVNAAVRMARSRYAMADVPLMRTEGSWGVAHSERLLAALLFPMTDRDRSALVQRWLRPQRQKGGYVHA